jgi:raffinose/stachyose/melibiose transport system substrate-binding protein
MRKKSWSLLLTFVLLFSMILTACGGKSETTKSSGDGKDENASKKEEVTISMTFANGDPAHAEGVTNIITAFEEKYPHIKIEENNSGTGSYLEVLQTKDAVGEFPDFVEMRDTQLFVDAGKLAELPKEIEGIFDQLPEVNGKHYVAPIAAQAPQGIMYNKKIFKDLELKEPKNLDEFLKLSEKIKDSGVSPLVVGGADLWHMGFLTSKFLVDEVYADNENWNSQRVKGEVKFTDDNMVKAITDLKKLWDDELVDKGWLSTPDNQTVAMLVSEKAAMLYSGTWMFSQILEADPNFDLGYFPIPDENGRVALPLLSTASGWGLSSEAAKDPAKAEAFKLFVEFFFSTDQYKQYLEKMNGLSSTKESITYEASEAMEKVMKVSNDPKTVKTLMWNQQFGDNMLPPQFRNWFYKTIQETLSGQMSVKEALEKAEAEWDVQYKAWKNQ